MKSYVSENWSFNPSKRLLARADSSSVKLPHKACQLLELLCEHSTKLLSSYQIIELIWDGNIIVGEQGLRQVVWRLRKEIPSASHDGPAIINVPRKGYQLRDKITVSQVNLPKRARNRYVSAAWLSLFTIFLVLLFFRTLNDNEKHLTLDVFPITSQSGHEESPKVSPDNHQLLYTSNVKGNFNIYRKNLDIHNGTDELIVNSPSNLGGIAWSKDGDKFAYLSTTENLNVDDVYIYDVQTGTKNLIAQQYVPAFSNAPFGLAWSPHEDILAYTSITENGTKSAIFLYDFQTQHSQQLSTPDYIDLHPAWSPDGKTITFNRISNPELSGLFSIDIGSGKVTDIAQANLKIYGHVWLDHQHILFSTYENGFFYPYILDLTNSKKTRVHIAGNFKFPGLSSTEVYYVRSSLERQIQRYRTNDSPLSLDEVIDSAGSETTPQIHTPTGRLVFISDRTGFKELWYRSAEKAELQQLTKQQSAIDYPSLSSSGQLVLFRQLNNATQALELAVYDLDKKVKTDLPIADAFLGIFAGSDRYITYIVVSDAERQLWLYDLHNQNTKMLAEGIWAPIGADQANNIVYFIKTGQIHSYNLDTDQTNPIAQQPEMRPPFTIQGNKIYYFQPTEANAELVQFNLNTGQTNVVLTLNNLLYSKLSEFAFDPHNNQIYLNLISKNESDIYHFPRPNL